jgi:hypothetical protein
MLKLKGSYKGVKNCVEMKKFDVTHSTIRCLGQKCYQPKKLITNFINQVSIKKNKNSDSDSYYIYHLYESIDDNNKIYYSGRWYNISFKFNKKSMNEKEQCITTKMTFVNEDISKKYRVEIKIFLNENGWKKLNSFIEL